MGEQDRWTMGDARERYHEKLLAEIKRLRQESERMREALVTVYFCRGCGMMLRHEVGTAVCDNCGNDQDPIEGKFAHDQAIALSEVA